jgi:formiminotetrahydrofolate cyclodeaminase
VVQTRLVGRPILIRLDNYSLGVTLLPQSLTELQIETFLDKLASSDPAPGGGSASALAVAVAAALVEMVAGLTLGREQFAAVAPDMKAVLAAAADLRSELVALVTRDTEAFDKVMAAMRLPKGTEEEKIRRREALQAATKEAAAIPLRVTALAAEVLALTRVVSEKGNPNAITDAGVAGRLALAGAEGAGINVRINLPGIKDEGFRRNTEDDLSRNLRLARQTAAEAAEAVEKRMVPA